MTVEIPLPTANKAIFYLEPFQTHPLNWGGKERATPTLYARIKTTTVERPYSAKMNDNDQALDSLFLIIALYALCKTKQREIFKAQQTKRGRKAGPPSRKALQQPYEYFEEPIITTDRPEPNTPQNPSYSTFSTQNRSQNISSPCPKNSSEHHEHETILNEGQYRSQSREIDDCSVTSPKSPPKSA